MNKSQRIRYPYRVNQELIANTMAHTQRKNVHHKSNVTDHTNCMLVFAPVRVNLKERCMLRTTCMGHAQICATKSTSVENRTRVHFVDCRDVSGLAPGFPKE